MKLYLEIFLSFFKIGAFTVGGGYAMLPLIEKEVVEKKGWISGADFLDMLAIVQSAPGPIALNIAVFVGYKIRGVTGSFVTGLGAILPSFLIILAIALFFKDFKNNPVVESAFKGIRPAVVALIAVPVVNMTRRLGFSPINLAIIAAVALLVWLAGVSPIYIIAAAAVGGIVYGNFFKKPQ